MGGYKTKLPRLKAALLFLLPQRRRLILNVCQIE